MICSGYEEWSKKDQDRFYHNLQIIDRAIHLLIALFWLVGLLIVFGWKRRDTKPNFVKVIWFLLSLVELGQIPF